MMPHRRRVQARVDAGEQHPKARRDQVGLGAALAACVVYAAMMEFGLLYVILSVPVIAATLATYRTYFERVADVVAAKPPQRAFVPLDAGTHARILAGEYRL